jgi:hypothetical protein
MKRPATVKKTNASGDAAEATALEVVGAEVDPADVPDAALDLVVDARVELVPVGLPVETVPFDAPVVDGVAVVVALLAEEMEARTEDADDARDEVDATDDAEDVTDEMTLDKTDEADEEADERAEERDDEAEAAAPPIN